MKRSFINKFLGAFMSLIMVLSIIPTGAVKAEALSNIRGKTFFFLGSSVTYGYAAGGVSFADYIAQRNQCTSIKEAVSGTTLVDNGSSSYIQRMKNGAFNSVDHCDHFICQLSTNDASQNKPLGSLSSSYDLNAFDTSTIYGAIEYIICYARTRWNCPVTFYTNTYYNNGNYQNMMNAIYNVQAKWNIGIIDLWNNEAMRNVSAADRSRYMADDIHPTSAGYLEWWTPVFENYLQNYNYSGSSTQPSSGPLEVIGEQFTSPASDTINVVWGQTQQQIDSGQKYNVYLNGTKVLSEVACGSYDLTGLAAGTYTIRITAVLNGQETAGVSGTVTVSGQSEQPTRPDVEGYVDANPGWTTLPYWSVYFAPDWANFPTGRYKAGNSYNDMSVLIDKASGIDWGIQLRTDTLSVVPNKSYTCKITVESNIATSVDMRLKEDISQAETLYKLAVGTNNIELSFTSSDNAQIIFDLGKAPADLKFTITSFELINNEPETTTQEPATEEQTTRIFDAYDTIEAEHFAYHEGGVVDNNSLASGGHNLGGVKNDTLTRYDNVIFSENAGGIEICYSSPTAIANGNAEIYVDGMDNRVASIVLTNNGTKWETYSVINARLDKEISQGSHSIYIKYVTTSTQSYVANVDYFKFISAKEYIKTIDGGIELNGYQVNTHVEGMRTVYSVDSSINGKAVVESGVIYSLEGYADDSEMTAVTDNDFVKGYASTQNGKLSFVSSDSDIATTYAMTMKFAVKTSREFTIRYMIRAYAKLSDGTYVYTPIYKYSTYEIADELYRTSGMSSEAAHNFLYTDILSVVNKDYEKVGFRPAMSMTE